jgi:hypothetical protein
MPVPPESSTVNDVNDVLDVNRSNWSTTFMTTGTNENVPTAFTVLAGGPADLAQAPPKDAESTNHASDEAKVNLIQILALLRALQDTFIPSVPEEIQAIIDSYLSGRPLLLVISNKRFFAHWSLRLPKEFGFLMLGYFRILGVQVLTSSNP